ncbi:hypothetical protein DVH24_021638 [Malus domestica]|uniref:Uncharacterized protein n=1 Tax=Malus domestica TaxID=3750 RepID=A0A498JXI6_MALDO|nr:hypothetical protein DVH24_021638 [Malus domestica]
MLEHVKHTPKYIVLPTGPQVQLNKTPLQESTTEVSSLETPIKSVTRTEETSRPISKMAAKKKDARGSSSNNDYSKQVTNLLANIH